MSNVIPFPLNSQKTPAIPAGAASLQSYEFTADELTQLFRWYSAMRYAFPDAEGVMMVSAEDKVSAIGLYGPGGRSPNCLISKHEAGGQSYLLWATEQDPPRRISSLGEIIERQIAAIEPPSDESLWLDAEGWMTLFTGRLQRHWESRTAEQGA